MLEASRESKTDTPEWKNDAIPPNFVALDACTIEKQDQSGPHHVVMLKLENIVEKLGVCPRDILYTSGMGQKFLFSLGGIRLIYYLVTVRSTARFK
ncbi:unnamed protein product [Sphenostylis stenocarpa]|uniref:Uncharacterized protein n=1 Tax=Sphenostylis stenocarpa TaxID=92480 RepID=A0AA86VKT5_9FABA|nr:unnamed protein product [Sphenostylis stenocarpa]